MRRALIFIGFWLLSTPTWAAPLAPVDAAALLAETRAANSKCSFLSSAASEELSIYAGRAEVGAVEAVGAELASERLAQARVDGGNYPCDDQSARKVTDIYTAAREAMNAVMGTSNAQNLANGPSIAVPNAKPSTAKGMPTPIEPRPRLAAAAPNAVQALPGRPGFAKLTTQAQPLNVRTAPSANLKTYPVPPANAARPANNSQQRQQVQQRQQAQQAQQNPSADPLRAYAWRVYAYYAAMRCPTLPANKMRRFWQNVANEHGRMLETQSPGAIERAQRQAQQQAARLACNAQTQQLVKRAASQY